MIKAISALKKKVIQKDCRSGIAYALLFLTLLLFVKGEGYSFDVDIWVRWTSQIFTHGLNSIYELPDNNYNPVYHYIMWLYGKLAGSVQNIDHYRNYLKGFTLLFDFIGAIAAASLLHKSRNRLQASLLILLNVAYLYNTLIWQQIDSIFTAFSFLAVVCGLRNKLTFSLIFLILALNTKPQAIVFLPLLLFILLPALIQNPRQGFQAVLGLFGAQLLLISPFIWGETNHLSRLLFINLNAVDYLPYVSINAFNIWVFFYPGIALNDFPDTMVFGGLSYKTWGMMWFFLASAVILFPVLFLALRYVFSRSVFSSKDYNVVLLSGGLVAIAFCFFNTQMHERYWHPAILFLGAYALVSRHYMVYIMCSAAYFLNLEFLLKYLELHTYQILPFNIRFIAGLFALSMLWGIWELYRSIPWKPYWREIKGKFRSGTHASTETKNFEIITQ